MESTPKKAPRSKFPALLVVALALVALVFVIWRVDSAPSTNDAYASADTIDVVPEVSGRIVELAVSDNQAVKQGDLLFRIDPRPYEANLAKAEASLAALDKQIMLTQRSVDAQQFGADSVNATVEKARAAAKQASDTLRRTEPLLREGFVSAFTELQKKTEAMFANITPDDISKLTSAMADGQFSEERLVKAYTNQMKGDADESVEQTERMD